MSTIMLQFGVFKYYMILLIRIRESIIVNNDTFLIEHGYIENAQSVCGCIDNPLIRNRSVANNLAANISAKYFDDINVDTISGLHNIFYVLNDIEISDIYINNNYIDVRIYFHNENILVPKSHFDYKLNPVAYMFIKLDEDLSNGSVTGFIFPENIDTIKELNGYYKINESDMVSYYDVAERLLELDDVDLPDNIESTVFDYLDDKLSNTEKIEFYQQLIKSKYLRELLINASKTKNIFNFVQFDNVDRETVNEQNNGLMDNQLNESIELDINPESDMLEEPENSDLTEIEATDELILNEDISDDIIELNNEYESLLQNDDILQLDSDDESVVDSEENDLAFIESDDLKTDDSDSLNADIEDDGEQFNNDTVACEETGSLDEISDDTDSDLNVEISYENEQPPDDFEELEKYDYETSTTPGIETIENEFNMQVDETNEYINEDDVDIKPGDATESGLSSVNEQQLDELFNNDDPKVVNTTKKKNLMFPLISILAVLGAAGYFGYTKFFKDSVIFNNVQNQDLGINTTTTLQQNDESNNMAMPVETIDNTETIDNMKEGNATSIPAIEQSLDATIDISNLSINWEVPVSYTSNPTAKRYFVRIGKILQLNLKTEMLLLSSMPITNKISLELEFDKNLSKFKIKNIIDSSGVSKIDDIVKETAQKTLNMNLNSNMSVFNALKGNPILVIKL